jgi:hypothetical protein
VDGVGVEDDGADVGEMGLVDGDEIDVDVRGAGLMEGEDGGADIEVPVADAREIRSGISTNFSCPLASIGKIFSFKKEAFSRSLGSVAHFQ